METREIQCKAVTDNAKANFTIKDSLSEVTGEDRIGRDTYMKKATTEAGVPAGRRDQQNLTKQRGRQEGRKMDTGGKLRQF